MIWTAALLLGLSRAASAEMMVVDELALGPVGPLYENGSVYYVEWGSSELTKWDGESISTIHQLDGCGQNGLATTVQDTFLVACFLSSDVLELDRGRYEPRRWNADCAGTKYISPKDFSVSTEGGIYMTVFGPWDAVPRRVAGTVVYRSPAPTNGSLSRTISISRTDLP